jgi:glutathionylspermidine synthase
MKRVAIGERPDWKVHAKELGFTVHTMYGARYWDERNAYEFTLSEIENDIEDPTAALLDMCYQAVEEISADTALMDRMAIPGEYHAAIRESWINRDRDLYGRFDLAYDGNSTAKMLEFNADTPTSLFESFVFQWAWLDDMKKRGLLPADADQFNSGHERLIEAFRYFGKNGELFHFGAMLESDEDRLTLEYLADCSAQAGCVVRTIDMPDIGVDAEDWFTDQDDVRMVNLFKLYPLETMVREEFGRKLVTTPTRVIEPLWKLTLSNKGLLPVLWEMFPGHGNLLPAFFSDDPKAKTLESFVRKPLLSREGANVTIVDPSIKGGRIDVDGPYGEEGFVVQATSLLPKFGDDWTVIGSWIVAGEPAGIGIREDDTPVTRDSSRFVPHYIKG